MDKRIKDYAGQASLASGTMKTVEMTMDTFPDHRTRTVRIWLPEGYDGVRKYPVLYVHDGQNMFSGLDDKQKWYADVEMKKVPDEAQVIIVAVDTSPARFEELCPPWPLTEWVKQKPYAQGLDAHGDWYSDFVINQVKPFVDANFATKPEPAFTGIGGSSMGSIQSMYMMFTRPDVFGRALCFSTATGMTEMERILAMVDEGYEKVKDHRMYLFSGGQVVDATIIRPTLEIYDLLTAKGMDYRHVCVMIDTREPHYESCWQKYFADAVRYLFVEDNSVTFPPYAMQPGKK